MSGGENVIHRDTKKLFVQRDKEESKIYYRQLIGNVNMSEGVVTFSIQNVYIVTMDKDNFKMTDFSYATGLVLTEDLLEIVEREKLENEEMKKFFRLGRKIGCKIFTSFQKYMSSIISKNHTLFKEEEFVNEHTELIRQVMERGYSETAITDDEGLCKYFEMPKCLKEFLKDGYFSNMTGYSDIRNLDNHPQRIKGVFAYYVSVGKFNRKTVKSYLEVFSEDFWKNQTQIDCFLNFIKKNLWMGDNVFMKAFSVFKYAETNNLPISESTINYKFYQGMKNSILLSDYYGKPISDEFHQVREMQGVVPALKQLIESVKEIKGT
jgi:predicted transcriptional regulator